MLRLVLFADDTTIFCSGKNLKELMGLITREICKLKTWFDRNKLSLNLTKTTFMLFGNNRISEHIQVQIEGIKLERVHETKFLGILIDDKISWKSHIQYIHGKISRSISIINKAKHNLDYKSLRILYCSIILPYFNYCVEVWGNNYTSSINSLNLLQKRAIRVIHKVGYRDHTNFLFLQANLLKFTDIVKFQTAQLMYKARKNMLPQNIQILFRDREGRYQLRGENNFRVNKIHTTRKSFCISFCGVKLWNSLGEDLKQCASLQQFKKKYKEHVFEGYGDESQVG